MVFHAALTAADPAAMAMPRHALASSVTPEAVDAATVAMNAWTAVLVARTRMSLMRGERVVMAPTVAAKKSG